MIKKYFVTSKSYAFMSKTWITACHYLFAFNQIFVLTLSDTFMCDDIKTNLKKEHFLLWGEFCVGNEIMDFSWIIFNLMDFDHFEFRI